MSYSCNACGRYITDGRSCDCYSPNPPTPAEIDILRTQLAQAKKELEEARAALREGTDIEPIVSESEYCWRIFVARKNATTWKKVSRQNQPAVRAAHGAERGREG